MTDRAYVFGGTVNLTQPSHLSIWQSLVEFRTCTVLRGGERSKKERKRWAKIS